MWNGSGTATADYLFCATRSGDIVKLYVDFLANDGSKNASVVAAAIKKAQKKQGMNAGKFTGGNHEYLECTELKINAISSLKFTLQLRSLGAINHVRRLQRGELLVKIKPIILNTHV